MRYYFCPRCNFRMTAAKPLCPTCGHKVPRPAKQTKAAEEVQVKAKAPDSTSLLSKLLRWDFTSPSKKTESA